MVVCPMADVDASAAATIAGSNDGRMIMAERPACPGGDDTRSAAPTTAPHARRALTLCAGVICAAVLPAAAASPEAPFAPIANVPDYFITMAERRPNTEITHTITHHDTWTRID